MGKYINVKQLYFLIFIIAMYGLIHLIRQNTGGNTEDRSGNAIPNLHLPFRTLPIQVTDRARCQQQCLEVSDTSLPLLMKFAWAETNTSPPYLEGNTLSGKIVKAYLTIHDNEVQIDSFDLGGTNCSCK